MELDFISGASDSDPATTDITMGDSDDEGSLPQSPNHSEHSELDEDATSTHEDYEEFVPYDEEEENGLDMMPVGGHVDAEVEALHHSLRECTHSCSKVL